MFQGTGSDVGKSLIVAGLCRLLANRGQAVSPFKPQNMSNNAAVTCDGGEIGRAQALQARAARTPLSVHMNPVLLKPQSDIGAQIVVQGAVYGTARARDYHKLKPELLEKVLESFSIVGTSSEIVLVEGAGSPAEVNLRSGDIANMGFAEAADVAVILVADIDRGGVIASLIGTYEVLTDTERARVKGFIVNKFRGDASLFDDGLKIITDHTGWSCFGIIPYFQGAHLLPQEDAMALNHKTVETSAHSIRIAVPRLPRIANFDDLDPLKAEPDVLVTIIEAGEPIPADTTLVFIPGSKSTCTDLSFLKQQGWDIDILAHHRRGGAIIGLCGGYQMLGHEVNDPHGIEGSVKRIAGLGLLDVTTLIQGTKALKEVSAVETTSGVAARGYEMHIGETTGRGTANPWFVIDGGRTDGCCSTDGLIFGSYLHGIFADDGFRSHFLQSFRTGAKNKTTYDRQVDGLLDELALHLEENLQIDALLKFVD